MIKNIAFYCVGSGLVVSGIATDNASVLRVSDCCKKTARFCVWDIGCGGTPSNECLRFNILFDKRDSLPRNLGNLFFNDSAPFFVRWAKTILINAKLFYAKVVCFIFVPINIVTHGVPPNAEITGSALLRSPGST